MKISTDIPKIYEKLHEVFGVEWEKGICIVYGDTCYTKYPLPPEKVAHEQVHADRQSFVAPEEWWRLYIQSKQFRLQEEIPAYRAEVKYIRENIKDRNKKTSMLLQLCFDLSSSMYGNMCTFTDAKKLIL